MFFSFFTRSLTHIAAYLYPSYSTYRALSSPTSALTTRELERWLEYWAVLGSFLAIESLVGWWVIGWWMPFYDELKLVTILWMVAPQAEGSSVVYNYYLSPFFTSHENDIDAVLGDLRSLAGGWIQRGIAYAWGMAREKLNLAAFLPSAPPAVLQQQQQQYLQNRPSHPTSFNSDSLLPSSLQTNRPSSPSSQAHYQGGYAGPPSLHSPSSSPPHQQAPPAPTPHTQAFRFASSLLSTYGPAVLSQAQAHFVPTSSHPSSAPSSRQQPRNQPQSRPHLEPHAPGSTSASDISPNARLWRRAQLEAELASLASPPSNNPTSRSRHTSNSNSPPASSDESLLGKSAWGEIDSDEGRDEPGAAGGMAGVGAGGARSSSWIRGWGRGGGGGGGGASAGGYGRVSGGDKED